MPPDPDHPFDPEDIPYFFDNWCSLPWTPWVPFTATRQVIHQIPREPGLYRIRPVGKDFLMYIGETKRSLFQRLQDLRLDVQGNDRMPWSDPHAEAPGLWAWQDAGGFEPERSSDLEDEENPQDSSTREGSPDPGEIVSQLRKSDKPVRVFRYECSATPLDATISGRRGMESFLLYKYRQERGESPVCNFGRFHPRYRTSTTKKEGLRGGRLAETHKDNPAGWPSIQPLEAAGTPGDSDWMGLEWTAWEPLPEAPARKIAAGAGLFLLRDAGSHEIVDIGQSADVAKRLLASSRKTGDGGVLEFSYQIIGPCGPPA